MRTQQQLKAVLKDNPGDFEALYELSKVFNDENQFAASFAMSDRAITSYETAPDPALKTQYFELKRLHAQLQRERLADILGPAIDFVNPQWVPVYRNGRPREMSWVINASNIKSITPALAAPQLKKLRFLNICIKDRPDETIRALAASNLSQIRSLAMQFNVQPDSRLLAKLLSEKHDAL